MSLSLESQRLMPPSWLSAPPSLKTSIAIMLTSPPVAREQREPLTENASSPYDPALDSLTLYEKKSVLVDRELDAMGMGRYQWMIFFLCGFAYMLDLLWAQVFGLVASPLRQELRFAGPSSTRSDWSGGQIEADMEEPCST